MSSTWHVYLRQVLAIISKELRQLARDRTLFGFIVYIFTLHIIVATPGMIWDLRYVRVVVSDEDHSFLSRELAGNLPAPQFERVQEVSDLASGVDAVVAGSGQVLMALPNDLDENIRQGVAPARVLLLVDGSKARSGVLSAGYLTQYVRTLSAKIAAATLARRGVDVRTLPTIDARQRIWFNFALRDAWPAAMSVLTTMMTVACVALPAAAAVREKERGTIEQLFVSPLGALQIMIAKTSAMALVTVLAAALGVFGIMQPVFHVPMRGSAVLFFASVALYAFTMSGLGLALATLARNSGQAGLLVILTTLPIVELSGTFGLVESMPAALRTAVQFSPLYHLIQITSGIAFRGQGMLELARPLLFMSALGAAIFGIGLWRFRRQFQ